MYFTKMVFCVLLMVLILHTVLADPINTTLSMDEMQQRCASLLEIHGHYFLLDETKTVAGIPDDMHVHGKSGDIYYTLINGEADLEVYVISKQTGLEKKINVAGGQSTAIDNTNNIVYFATENGVYKQKDDGSIELYAASGADVMDISLTKDGSIMYIATFPKYDVYKITQNGKNMENVSAISYGRAITVDTEGNLIFTDLKMAYVLQAGQTIPKKIEGLPSDKLFDFCINKDNEVLAMDGDSQLYQVDVHAASATYWGSFGLPVSNTFAVDDDNNMYIGIEGAIKKFKHYNENPCTKA